MSYNEKLYKPGPRKLLACDGGGIRGIISIAKIDSDLRASNECPNLVLSEYFDYVADPGIGAIIATLVSLGCSVDEIRDFYLETGDQNPVNSGLRPGHPYLRVSLLPL